MELDPLYKSIKEKIMAANNVLAICHIGPDGDAFGSLTGVGLMVQSFGKKITLVCDDGMSNRFRYLPLADKVAEAPDDNEAYDLLITVDCGDVQRLGDAHIALPEPKPFTINIDHHITNTLFGDINLIQAETTSTCEMLVGLANGMDVAITKDLATSLLTGIVTDTLSFRIPAVTSQTFEVAGEMIDAGANIAEITMEALNLKPYTMLKLWGVGLSNMQFAKGFLYTAISREDRLRTGYLGTGSSGLSSMLGDCSEAMMGAVIMEGDHGNVNVSFRARPPFTVAEMARDLGGGGHAQAAGCTIEAPLEDVVKLVVAAASEAIKEQTVQYA